MAVYLIGTHVIMRPSFRRSAESLNRVIKTTTHESPSSPKFVTTKNTHPPKKNNLKTNFQTKVAMIMACNNSRRRFPRHPRRMGTLPVRPQSGGPIADQWRTPRHALA